MGFSIGSMLKNPLVGTGVQGLFSLFGQKAQNKANQYSVDAQTAAAAKTMQLELATQAEQKRQFNAQQAALAAQQTATNSYNAQLLAAQNEQNAYNRSQGDYARSQSDYTRSLEEKRQAYLAPYRAQSAQARYSLMKMLGLG